MWPGKIILLLSDDRILALEKQTHLVGGGDPQQKDLLAWTET